MRSPHPFSTPVTVLTNEQLRVLDALLNAHAEAAREMGRLAGRMQLARRQRDRAGFLAIGAELARANQRCLALKLAIDIASETFGTPRYPSAATRKP